MNTRTLEVDSTKTEEPAGEGKRWANSSYDPARSMGKSKEKESSSSPSSSYFQVEGT